MLKYYLRSLTITGWLIAIFIAQISQSPTVVTVGDHSITSAHADHWITRQFPAWKRDPQLAPTEVRTAVVKSLVNRQLAMHRLLELGGESLKATIDRRLQSELQRRIQIDEADNLALPETDTLAWETAWKSYLKKYLTEQNLTQFFASRKARYDGTQRSASQIFLPPNPDSKSRLETLRQQISSGEITFADAARKSSESPTAADGGSLGWVEYRGDLPTMVAEAIFGSPLDRVVGPIESPLGWHLLHVHQQRDGTLTYETLVDHQQLRQDAANFLFERLVEASREKHEVTWKED